jgi:hypothetical protein
MKRPTTFFMAMLVSYALHGQQDVFKQYTYWLRYQNQLQFSPRLYWTNEFDNRRFFDPDVALQFITHSRVHYKTGRWDLGGGLTYSLAFAQKPEVGYTKAMAEIRPVAEASYEVPLGKIFLQSRLRIDNRFIQTDPEQSVLKESLYIMRFRYRAQLRIPVKTNAENITTVGVRFADEIMFNSKGNTFDQNRVYATGEFFLSKKISLEAGYIYIYQQRFRTEEFFERHVVRFSVLHRIQCY